MTFRIVNNLSKTDTILNYVGTMRPKKSCSATMASFQYSSVSINDSQFIRRFAKTKRNELHINIMLEQNYHSGLARRGGYKQSYDVVESK